MLNAILVTLVAIYLVVGLARRGRGRKNFSKYLDGAIESSVAMTTLASETGVTVSSQTVTDTTRISSVECTYSLRDLTPAVNVGPFVFGVAHSDYTLAEIEEWIEATGGWDAGNLVQTREVRSRFIRQIGVMPFVDSADQAAVPNNGNPIKTILNWMLAEGDGLKFWIYNTGAQPVATTVPDFQIYGKANLWGQ